MSFWARMFGKEAAEPEAPVAEPEAAPPPVPEPEAAALPEPEPTAGPEPEPPTVEHVAVVREPEPELAAPEVAPEPRRAAAPTGEITEDELETRLTALLDSLGSAHRRPFVRNG